MACPAWENVALRGSNVTGDSLLGGNDYAVIAGGTQALPDCGFRHPGYVGSRPDFEFHVTRMVQYRRLRMRVRGTCDTVLLINGASGHWYFDDNSAGYDPMIEFSGQITGTFDVWVGTYGPDTCPATLVVESR